MTGDFTDDQTLHSIGDVARLLDMPQHVLRYWEQRLPGLRPVKRAGGRRYYRDRDVALIRHTRDLVERQGYRLDAAARIAADHAAGRGDAATALGAPVLAAPVHAPARHDEGPAGDGRLSVDVLRQLRAIRGQLVRALH